MMGVYIKQVVLIEDPIDFTIRIPIRKSNSIDRQTFEKCRSAVPPPMYQFILLIFMSMCIITENINKH